MVEAYRKTVLDNGVRIVTERMENMRSVSVGVWLTSGSRHETKPINGISHLLEHMVFKGTQSRTAYDIATSLESLGGHLNAFTEREFTCYYAYVLDENLPDAIDVISDVVQNGRLGIEDLDNEKQIVFEEIQNMMDAPEDLLLDSFLQNLFNNHGLGLSTLGSIESVRGIGRADLIEYKNHHYTAENLIVSAAGHLDHDELVSLVQKYFGNLQKGESQREDSLQFGPLSSHIKKSEINQAHLCTGSIGYSYHDPNKFALIILNAILGGGMSSRLFQNLREKRGLAYSVYSFLEFFSDTGLIGIYTGTSPKNLEEAKSLIENELSRLCTERITKEELERTQQQLTRSLILSMEDNTSRMNRLAKREAYSGTYRPLNDIVQHVLSVTQETIQEVAIQLFQVNRRYTSTVEP